MCRNIKTLYNFSPPATKDEIRASAIQFVRKLSGMNAPSKANEAAFNRAVDQVTRAAEDLLASLVTMAPPRDRDVEAEKARARGTPCGSARESGVRPVRHFDLAGSGFLSSLSRNRPESASRTTKRPARSSGVPLVARRAARFSA